MISLHCHRRRCAALAAGELVHLGHDPNDLVLVRLRNKPADDDLHQHVLHAVGVEDDVELADALEEAVERLDEDLDQIDDRELRLGRVDDEDEAERGVAAVDEAGVGRGPLLEVVDEVAHVVAARVGGEEALVHEVLLELGADGMLEEVQHADLALRVDDENGLDHFFKKRELKKKNNDENTF